MTHPTHRRPASLRIRYALWLMPFLLLPLVAYQLLDTRLDRAAIVQGRLEVHGAMAGLLLDAMGSGATLQDGCPDWSSLQPVLRGFAENHPYFDVMLLGPDARVVASTVPGRIGQTWQEKGILEVLEGRATESWSLSEHDGLPVLDYTRGTSGSAACRAALHIAEPQRLLQDQIRRAITRDVAFFGLLAVLLLLLSYELTNRLIIRRLDGLSTLLVDSGWNPEGPTSLDGDELERLRHTVSELLARIKDRTVALQEAVKDKDRLLLQVQTFNQELTRQVQAAREEVLTIQSELVRRERLAAVGEMAASLAHEIRNPLQIVRATAETGCRHHPGAVELFRDVVEEVARMENLVRLLFDYVRPLELNREFFGLLDVARRALNEVKQAGAYASLELAIPEDLRVLGDPALIERVLVNLLLNAVQSLPSRGGSVRLSAREEAQETRIEILDDGAGIAPEDAYKVFDPFFSRKPSGVGMGLALARRIVEQHEGTIELLPRAGGGTLAVVRLSTR